MTRAPIDTRRLFGFDLIRLVSFFAIASFHISLIHWSTPGIYISARSTVISAVESVSRMFSFSGFTIVFITSILIALSGSSLAKRMRLFSFLFFGWIIFSALIYTQNGFFDWDIYPLIFLGIAVMTFSERIHPRWVNRLTIAGFLMMWIPFWKLGPHLVMPTGMRQVFGFADCRTAVSEWPILPWIGLVFFGYGCGMHLRHLRQRGKAHVLRISWREAAVWTVTLGATLPFLGSFYGIHLGRFFACEAYRQEPHIFMSHFAWVMFACRACVDPRVNRFLGRFTLCHFVSNLKISRKFWLAYFLNFLLAHLVSFIGTESRVEETSWEVPVVAIIAVGFVPLTEVVTRVVLYSFTGVPQDGTVRRKASNPSSS